MPELRWTLLILGLLFIAALAWWETRRRRKLPEPHRQASHFREPTLTLPQIRPREPAAAELPVVDFTDDSLLGLRVDGVRIEEDLAASEPAAVEAEVVVPEEQAAPPAEPAPSPSPAVAVPDAPLPTEPIVEWPPEDERELVAVRLVAHSGGRFHGRALRQALAAEGFMLGKLAIFHKPGLNARAVVSAASLMQPGSFDLDTMDTQRYAGLSLFAVLPGPLPAPQMFDELITAARALSERLQATLQDAQGEPLTPLRAASLRERLLAERRA